MADSERQPDILASQTSDPRGRQPEHATAINKICQRWPIIAVTAAGIFAVGHTIGAIEGLVVGSKHVIEYFLVSHAPNRGPGFRLATELREEFTLARNKFEQTSVADFSRVDRIISTLEQVDNQNSVIWYFAGEIKRITKPEWFTIKSCIRNISGQIPDLASYQQDFHRYLDDARTVSSKDIGDKMDSKSCYDNPRGFCIQRIAWVHHLLANDFFEQALAVADPLDKIGNLELVLQHSKEALKYQHEGRNGFLQCTDTLVLREKALEQLTRLHQSR